MPPAFATSQLDAIAAEDPFNAVAAGRAAFRVEQLLELAHLIGG